MRGDPPLCQELIKGCDQSTPHARGSTHVAFLRENESNVYPACAGIHPPKGITDSPPSRLPRMRGDPP